MLSVFENLRYGNGGTHDVEDGSVGVAGVLVLGGVSDKTLVIGEGDP